MNRKVVYTASCLLVLLLFCLHEIFLNFHPDIRNVRVALKFSMSFIPFVLSYFGWKNHRNVLGLYVTEGLLLCCIADAVINLQLIVGIVLYMLGHLCFIVGFIKIRKPHFIQYVLWIVTALTISLLLWFVPEKPAQIKIAAIVYTLFMTAMVSFSYCGSMRIFLGGIIFGLSDILLMISMALGINDGIFHIFSLGIYYLGVLMFANRTFVGAEDAIPVI